MLVIRIYMQSAFKFPSSIALAKTSSVRFGNKSFGNKFFGNKSLGKFR